MTQSHSTLISDTILQFKNPKMQKKKMKNEIY